MKKLVVGSIVLIFCALGWRDSGFGEQVPAPQGELRIVDKHPLNWIWIVYNVFEHLLELDKDGTLVPRLATSWRWLDDRTLEFTLRQGVKFHNGEVFDADIVKLNWEDITRLQQPFRVGTFLNFKSGSRLEILDPYTVRFVFPEPDGGALTKLIYMHMANRQFYRDFSWGEKGWCIIEGAGPWGTGPYKMVEGVSTPKQQSDRLVLEANPDYWDTTRLPRLQRIVFDNALGQKDAVELVKSGAGRVDLVTGLSPLETLRVAQSPSAKVVKARGSLSTVLGLFNMRKTGSPWQDVRLRQAVNLAINREDLIRYATRGNGVIIPALIAPQGFGHDPTLAPYPFDPDQTRHLLRAAGYSNGLPVRLVTTRDLEVQSTVVSKMLEHGGFQVELQILDPTAYNRQTLMSQLEQPPEQQAWDIALTAQLDSHNAPMFNLYHWFALDGPYDWVLEQPELRQLYEQALRTVDRERQQEVIRQMERHTRDQAYFLFLYNPIALYAVNKAVEFVPYVSTMLDLDETGVTEQHWSVRKQKATMQE